MKRILTLTFALFAALLASNLAATSHHSSKTPYKTQGMSENAKQNGKVTMIHGQPVKFVKVSPKIRQEHIDDVTLVLPLNIVSPFLSRSRVIGEKDLKHKPTIIATDENRLIVGKEDKIFVKGIHDNLVKSYDIVRKGQVFRDPDTNEILGYEATMLGHAKLVRLTKPAVMRITNSNQEVLVGDKLIPQDDDLTHGEFELHYPEQPVNSKILTVTSGVDLVGQFNIITIKGGKNVGFEPGDLLGIYRARNTYQDFGRRRKKIHLPQELAGEIMIFRTFDKISYAVVLNASKTVFIGDKIANL